MKRQPVAACSDCITYSYDDGDIGTRCTLVKGERRCAGILADVSDPINWKECSACSGTGIAWDKKPCRACQESGWILTRRR